MFCENFPNLRCLILRQTRASLSESALVTFEDQVLPVGHPAFGNHTQRRLRHSYRYPNGSEIVVGGLDDPQRVMSTEYDLVYIMEAIEAEEHAWEMISTRLRNGKLFYQQLLADTNPSSPTHWLIRRCRSTPPKTTLIEASHEDNPVLYDHINHRWTDEGIRYLVTLDNLTGARKDRLRYGKWVQAEGVVYEGWDTKIHLIPKILPPIEAERYWVIDFGWNDPFVCLMAYRDSDGRLVVYRQIYGSQRLVEDWAKVIRREWHDEAAQLAKVSRSQYTVEAAIKRITPATVICDHNKDGQMILERHLGIGTTPARKKIERGIELVKSRLKPSGDGIPRLLVCRDSLVERCPHLDESKRPVCLEEEMDAYIMNPSKDMPVDRDNHALDCLRYLCAYHDSAAFWEAPSVAAPSDSGKRDEMPRLNERDGQPRLRFGGELPRKGRRLFG